MHRRVGPPQKRLGFAGAIAQLHINLEHRLVGVQREAVHAFGKNICSTSLHHKVTLPSSLLTMRQLTGKKVLGR
jgi:hypothetical protein